MNNETNEIKLTLAPDMEVPEPEPVTDVQISPVEAAAAHPLTEAEQAMVKEFAQKIDVTNSSQIMQYGNAAQKKISDFSESTLSNVRTKDMDEVGRMLTGLVTELRGFSPEAEQKGLMGLFRKQMNSMEAMKAKYTSVEANIDKICGSLEKHQIVLIRDIALLDKMYEKNLAYFKELTMYILAGREKLREINEKEIPEKQALARETGRPEDAQAANYLADMANRFDKKLYDLDLTRTISVQMGPQIRLVQSTNQILVEKIQTSLMNTIPLWKNQMVLSLGIAHSQGAIQAQRQVTEITNELLRKNADTLKANTVEAAKESERGIVDIETLRHTNQSLISTLDEVLKIQTEGRQKRREAETELRRIEGELKSKLLELRDMRQQPPSA
jgi:uncharacterized protein YaaN involved in tellurite resistance